MTSPQLNANLTALITDSNNRQAKFYLATTLLTRRIWITLLPVGFFSLVRLLLRRLPVAIIRIPLHISHFILLADPDPFKSNPARAASASAFTTMVKVTTTVKHNLIYLFESLANQLSFNRSAVTTGC